MDRLLAYCIIAFSFMYRSRRRAASGPGEIDPNTQSNKVRLVGGTYKDEGFVEFFNATANRWDLACDNQFSEEVGRVTCRQMGKESDNR